MSFLSIFLVWFTTPVFRAKQYSTLSQLTGLQRGSNLSTLTHNKSLLSMKIWLRVAHLCECPLQGNAKLQMRMCNIFMTTQKIYVQDAYFNIFKMKSLSKENSICIQSASLYSKCLLNSLKITNHFGESFENNPLTC